MKSLTLNRTALVQVLGCKVNQAEAASLAGILEEIRGLAFKNKKATEVSFSSEKGSLRGFRLIAFFLRRNGTVPDFMPDV